MVTWKWYNSTAKPVFLKTKTYSYWVNLSMKIRVIFILSKLFKNTSWFKLDKTQVIKKEFSDRF